MSTTVNNNLSYTQNQLSSSPEISEKEGGSILSTSVSSDSESSLEELSEIPENGSTKSSQTNCSLPNTSSMSFLISSLRESFLITPNTRNNE